MKIIGLSSHRSGVHDNSMALIKDGKVLFAEAEERVSRKKHDGRFPWLAIKEALKYTNTKLSEIDYFVSANPEESLFKMFLTSLKFLSVVGFGRYFSNAIGRLIYKIEKPSDGNRPKSYNEAGFSNEKLIKVSHYMAHAASGYYSSPFDKCLVVAMDGFAPGIKGEPLSGQIYLGSSGELKFLEDVPVWGTLGLYYGAVTKALGFKLNDGEGKTMGLAAYGDPKICYSKMKSFFPNFINGKWTIKPTIMDILNIRRIEAFENSDTLRLLNSCIDKNGKENVAAACQKVFEEEVMKYVKHLVRKYEHKEIVLVGGIFLNVKANMKLLNDKLIEDIFVYPNPADGGTAMGAAMIGFIMKEKGIERKELLHPVFGREYSDREILKVIGKTKGVAYKKVKRGLPKIVAKMLVDQKVVGWFQGRDEWGPRALGQRSVLADPRKMANKDRINDILKGRDWFMPFAPSMLFERTGDYLKVLKKGPFMIVADDIKKGKIREIQAAKHIDNTVRPHIVTKDANPLYHQVIKEFERLTGVGAILNTSFNKHGLPIVYSPKDAIEHLLWETIDVLVIGNYVISRTPEKKKL